MAIEIEVAEKISSDSNTIVDPSKAKKLDKREAIIEAAHALFTTEGYETTTIAQVARKANVAVGTVYLYFKNKQELLFAVQDDWEDHFLEFMSQPDVRATPHYLRARALVEACFQLCAENTQSVQLMGVSPQMIGEIYSKGGQRIIAAIKAFFDEAFAAGAFRAMNTEIAAVIAFKMVNGALEQCFEIEGGRNPQAYIDTLVDAFEHWLVKPEFLQS